MFLQNLVASLILFFLSWVVRRVTGNVLASVLVFGEQERWAAGAGAGCVCVCMCVSVLPPALG